MVGDVDAHDLVAGDPALAGSPLPSGVTTAARAGLPRSPGAALPEGSATAPRHRRRGLWGRAVCTVAGRGGGRGPSPPGVRTPASGGFPSQTGIPGFLVSAGCRGWDRPTVAGWGQPLSQPHEASDAMAVAPAEAADRTAAPRHPDSPVHGDTRLFGHPGAGRGRSRGRPTTFAPATAVREGGGWCGSDSPALDLIPIRKGTRI